MNETNYTPVTDGFHDCKIVFAKRAGKHYGKPINGHVVFELKLVATDTDIENPAAYRAEVAVALVPGFEWDFYNEKTNKGEWRKATAADAKATLEYAQKCFPAWKEYCDNLTKGCEEAALSWFTNEAVDEAVTVRAKLVNGGTFVGGDGLEHADLKAKVYAPYEKKPVVDKGEAANIVKALKVAGFKLGGVNGSRAKTAPVAPKKPEPPKPPKKPETKTVDQLMQDALAAYEESYGKDDLQGAKYYARAAEIVGKPDYTWDSWTAEEWTKIVAAFAMPF